MRLAFSPALVLLRMLSIFGAIAHSQQDPEVLPTGMRLTPLAAPGSAMQPLNPGLPTLPDFKAGMAVTTGLSPDGRTMLVLTSGFNQNLDANENVDPATSNEYVFVFDVSEGKARKTQILQIHTNAFDGLAWNPNGKEFYVSGGPDDLVHVFDWRKDTWTEVTTVPLGHNGIGLGLYGILPVAAGMDVTRDGKHLIVANYENDSVSAIDLETHTVVAELDLRPGVSTRAKAGHRAERIHIG